MCVETIRVGPWPMCVGWLVALLPIAATLFGVILGGTISFGTALIIENRRTARAREEEYRRLAEERANERRALQREALEKALEWFNPLELALIQAELTALAYVRGQIDESQLRIKYPRDISITMEREYGLPPHLSMHMPEDAGRRANQIVSEFEQLFQMALDNPASGNDVWMRVQAFGNQIREHISSLRNDLRASYSRTFD